MLSETGTLALKITTEYFLSRYIFKNCMFLTRDFSVYCRTSELEDLLTKNVSKESVIFDGKVIKKSAMKDIDRLEPIGQILEADDSPAKQPVCSLNIIFINNSEEISVQSYEKVENME